ncbi:leucine-rich repeat-containing protein 74B [Nematostella vectensis]|nr:leucine-rich repeat-containing protein 74B [Nematostella vectensis]
MESVVRKADLQLLPSLPKEEDNDICEDISQETVIKGKTLPEKRMDAKFIVAMYKDACKQYNTFPVSKFIRQYPTGVIDLKHYGVGDKGALALATVLKQGEVSSLCLHDNGIGIEGLRCLSTMLTTNACIKSLDLSGNPVNKSSIACLGRMLSDNIFLYDLNLSTCGIQGKNAVALLEALRYHTSIKTLNLSYNDLGLEGATLIGLVLRDNKRLHYLDISWNNIRDTDKIAEGLVTNTCLEILDLSRNGFGDRGAENLSQALLQNLTLRELNVSGACIGLAGVKLIAGSLKRNKVLEVLKIGNNPMLPEGAHELLRCAMRSPMTLAELHLDQVVLNVECEKSLDDIFELNPAFYCISDVSIKGGAVTSGNRPEIIDVFFSHLNAQELRLHDLFKMLSNNYSGSVVMKKEDFVAGMRKLKLPMGEQQLAALFDTIDDDGSGGLTYQEFINMKKRRQSRTRKGLGKTVLTMVAAMKLRGTNSSV